MNNICNHIKENSKNSKKLNIFLTRFFAVQILYNFLFNIKNLNQELDINLFLQKNKDYLIIEYNDKKGQYDDIIDYKFLEEIISDKLISNLDIIDSKIKSFIKNDINNIFYLTLIILRIAIFDLLFLNESKKNKKIINQYILIASFFLDKKNISFINFIIDNLQYDK